MNRLWTIDSGDDLGEVNPSSLTAETEAAELADTLLVGEIEVSLMLVTYLVKVGQHREAAGLLNDSDRQQLREVERSASKMIEALDSFLNEPGQDVVIDATEDEQ